MYNDNENPNHDELPKYILVEFTQYKGPILVPDNPLLVPIPPMEVNCNRKRCCRRKYVPLVLAFAKTVHTFQGQNVGPVQPGQSPNAFEKIIADPGAKSFEGTNPGLFYSTTSRATTIGTKENKFSSSLYFTGNNMNRERISNMTTNKQGQTYKKVQRRKEWVQYLNSNNHQSNLSPSQKEEIFK